MDSSWNGKHFDLYNGSFIAYWLEMLYLKIDEWKLALKTWLMYSFVDHGHGVNG